MSQNEFFGFEEQFKVVGLFDLVGLFDRVGHFECVEISENVDELGLFEEIIRFPLFFVHRERRGKSSSSKKNQGLLT